MSLQKHKNQNNVVVLKKRNSNPVVTTIYQEDLIEFLVLRRNLAKAKIAFRIKRHYIMNALQSGAEVEPGAFTAELVERIGGGYQVDAFSYLDLVVR
jgi:transcriptional antiterminator